MRTALAFFILIIVLSSVYFGGGHSLGLPAKNDLSPVPKGSVVQIKELSIGLTASIVTAGTQFLQPDYWQNLWSTIKTAIKTFFQSLFSYLKTWPLRAKNNWLKFLGYPVDTGDRQVGYPNPGALNNGGTVSERVDYQLNYSTTTPADSLESNADSVGGGDLGLAVVPANDFTPAQLADRLARTFSDPVQITINEANRSGIVVPQFKNGLGRTYIFLLTDDNSLTNLSTP